MSSSSAWVCHLCQTASATFFCTCSDPEVFLCEQCIGKHYTSWPALHHCLPNAAFGEHKIPGYFERLSARRVSYTRKAEEFRKSLERIVLCSEEFNGMIDELVGTIEEYRRETINKLMKLKEDLTVQLESACKLVGESLYMDKFSSDDRLASFLRNPEAHHNFHVFTYTLNDLPVKQTLRTLLTYDYFYYISESVLLPMITDNTLKLMQWSGESEYAIPLIKQFDSRTTMLVPMNQVVVVFEGKNSRRVFVVNIKSKALSEINERLYMNWNCGIHREGDTIYLFGGMGNTGKECEKFNVTGKTTVEVKGMEHSRSNFTPVKYGKSIYLIAVAIPVEIFDMTTEQFSVANVCIYSGTGPTVSWLSNEELITLSLADKALYRLNLVPEETSPRAFKLNFYTYTGSARGCTRIVKEGVMWVDDEGVIWKYSSGDNRIKYLRYDKRHRIEWYY